MNGQLMEYWGRTMLAALQGQNQMDAMTGWFQRMCRDMAHMNSSFFQLWGIPEAPAPQNDLQRQWEQAWEQLLRMQQLSMQWIGMVPNSDSVAQSKKIAQLEEQVQEQARTIEHLQNLMNKSGAGNNEMINQFQKLIDQQSRQFKQLTTSVGEYIQSSAAKTGAPKQP
jgi:DNA-binding protein H-NS